MKEKFLLIFGYIVNKLGYVLFFCGLRVKWFNVGKDVYNIMLIKLFLKWRGS